MKKHLQGSGWLQDQLKEEKSVALSYINDKQAEREIRETTPFTIATNNIKYLGVTLTNHAKDLCDKNFKFRRKKLKKISENGKVSHAHILVELT